MIEEIEYKGKIVKCDVKPDIFMISLLSFAGFGMPIYFLMIQEYFLAALVHVLVLIGVILSKGIIFKSYVPITEESGKNK